VTSGTQTTCNTTRSGRFPDYLTAGNWWKPS